MEHRRVFYEQRFGDGAQSATVAYDNDAVFLSVRTSPRSRPKPLELNRFDAVELASALLQAVIRSKEGR